MYLYIQDYLINLRCEIHPTLRKTIYLHVKKKKINMEMTESIVNYIVPTKKIPQKYDFVQELVYYLCINFIKNKTPICNLNY